MCPKFIFTFVLGIALGFAVQAQETPGNPLGPAAQKLVQLEKAGVDELTLLSYVQNSQTGFDLTADGVLALKDAGVPSSVISAALKKTSVVQAAPAVTADKVEEWDLFRLFYGRIYYKNKVYFLNDGLDPYLQQVILSDPETHAYMKDYQDLKNTTTTLAWSGIGLLVGGAVYGAVSSAQADAQPWMMGVSLGSMGVGIVMTMVSAFTDRASFQNLMNSMTQYNQDLVVSQSRR